MGSKPTAIGRRKIIITKGIKNTPV